MSRFIALMNLDGAPVDRILLQSLTDFLSPRGPDALNVRLLGQVGLGHALFRTTLEAKAEQQPLSLDGEVWLVGSLRIDARQALIERLGFATPLSSAPDPELLLHAYRRWGTHCLEHVLGDYAFVLWDSGQQLLFAALDRFGMRQLYYARDGQQLIISNSLDCMRRHPAISGQLDETALADFLLFGDHRLQDKQRTCLRDVSTLAPAHYLTLRNGKIKTRRYWQIPEQVPLLQYQKERDYLEHFQEVFSRVVIDRVRTQNVAIALSGGLDSSRIVATVRASRRKGYSLLELIAYTVQYDSIHPSDERYYAGLVSETLGIDHVSLDAGDFPLMSRRMITTRPCELYQPELWFDLERQACSSGRVLLTGDAGDNLLVFPGLMNTTQASSPVRLIKTLLWLKKRYGVFPTLGTGLYRKFKSCFGTKDFAPYGYPDWLNPELERKLDLKNRWKEVWSDHHRVAPGQYGKLRCYMTEPDWNSDDFYLYEAGILPEKRDPFLDPRLLDFIMSLPAIPWLFKKHLLRRSLAGVLPDEIIRRPKVTLGCMHSSLVRRADYRQLNDWQPVSQLAEYLDRDKVPKLIYGRNNDAMLYLNLRPLLLNNWLQGWTQAQT